MFNAFRFYGFCIDVLERISKMIGFNYILDLVHDRKVSLNNSIFLDGDLLMNILIPLKVRCQRRHDGRMEW